MPAFVVTGDTLRFVTEACKALLAMVAKLKGDADCATGSSLETTGERT